MNIDNVLNKARANDRLNDQEVRVLMLHAIDLLKHFNKLTQGSIDELTAFHNEQADLLLAA